MPITWYSSGQWNVICDVCGERYKSDQLKKRWDGLMTCRPCWEIRHPQDMLRPIREYIAVPWTRPEPYGNDPTPPNPQCTVTGVYAVPNYAQPNCAIPNTLFPGLL